MKWKKNTLKVYKWIFQIVIAKNLSTTCICNQRNLFNILIHWSLSSLFECSWKNIRLFLLYSNVHEKTFVSFFYIWMFMKKQSPKCLFKIPLCREIDNTIFYFVIFLKKIKVKSGFQYRYILEISTFEYGCLVQPHIKKGRGRGGVARHWWITC